MKELFIVKLKWQCLLCESEILCIIIFLFHVAVYTCTSNLIQGQLQHQVSYGQLHGGIRYHENFLLLNYLWLPNTFFPNLEFLAQCGEWIKHVGHFHQYYCKLHSCRFQSPIIKQLITNILIEFRIYHQLFKCRHNDIFHLFC